MQDVLRINPCQGFTGADASSKLMPCVKAELRARTLSTNPVTSLPLLWVGEVLKCSAERLQDVALVDYTIATTSIEDSGSAELEASDRESCSRVGLQPDH